MKKIFLLMAIVLPFIFGSCGDDGDVLSSREEQLVGEWAIINTPETQGEDFHYVFKKERTGSRWHLEDGTVVSDIAFKWILDGNLLTLDYGTGIKLELEISINNDILHIIYKSTGVAEDYKKVVKTED
ncbi:MAG: hypothetical protein IKX63_05425 [Muribaculaceae bacterium]|nr:hypothetical protein [Muribaculaceae bacterium]